MHFEKLRGLGCGLFHLHVRSGGSALKHVEDNQRVANKKTRQMAGFLIWWALPDLNRGPKDYESSALTN